MADPTPPVDIEILEVTIQPQSQVNATITIGGVPITGTWTLVALQPWSSPGFVLERGKVASLQFQQSATVGLTNPQLKTLLKSLVDAQVFLFATLQAFVGTNFTL